MYGFDFYKFKLALKKLEEENYAKLQLEVAKVKEFVEKTLTAMLECTAGKARTNYTCLEMH